MRLYLLMGLTLWSGLCAARTIAVVGDDPCADLLDGRVLPALACTQKVAGDDVAAYYPLGNADTHAALWLTSAKVGTLGIYPWGSTPTGWLRDSAMWSAWFEAWWASDGKSPVAVSLVKRGSYPWQAYVESAESLRKQYGADVVCRVLYIGKPEKPGDTHIDLSRRLRLAATDTYKRYFEGGAAIPRRVVYPTEASGLPVVNLAKLKLSGYSLRHALAKVAAAAHVNMIYGYPMAGADTLTVHDLTGAVQAALDTQADMPREPVSEWNARDVRNGRKRTVADNCTVGGGQNLFALGYPKVTHYCDVDGWGVEFELMGAMTPGRPATLQAACYANRAILGLVANNVRDALLKNMAKLKEKRTLPAEDSYLLMQSWLAPLFELAYVDAVKGDRLAVWRSWVQDTKEANALYAAGELYLQARERMATRFLAAYASGQSPSVLFAMQGSDWAAGAYTLSSKIHLKYADGVSKDYLNGLLAKTAAASATRLAGDAYTESLRQAMLHPEVAITPVPAEGPMKGVFRRNPVTLRYEVPCLFGDVIPKEPDLPAGATHIEVFERLSAEYSERMNIEARERVQQ